MTIEFHHTLSDEEQRQVDEAFRDKVGVEVRSDRTTYTHPLCGYTIKSDGLLVISPRAGGDTIAAYRVWESVRAYGEGLTPVP